MKLIQRLLFVALAALSMPSCAKKDTVSPTGMDSVTIGGLFSLTGNWSSLGNSSTAALQLAVQDINSYLADRSVNFRLAYRVYDTKLDPATAASATDAAMTEKKIRYFIGPQSSAELAGLKDKISTNNLLMISQGSTASTLALPGDAIFRFCPGDQVEGKAIAKTMWTDNKTYVITLARDDAGNRGLQTSVGSHAQSLGAIVDAITPYSATSTDFSSLLATLKTKIQTNTATLGTAHVAVYLASFDEAKELFHQAASDATLASVDWYGGDGVVLSSVLTSDSLAADFAMRTHFFAPNFGVPTNTNPDHDRIYNAIKTASGIEPDAYALSVYDAAWVLARALSSYPTARTDLAVLKSGLVSEANKYYGISGPVTLDANGDRAVGSFDYYGIRKTGNNFTWVLVGKSE